MLFRSVSQSRYVVFALESELGSPLEFALGSPWASVLVFRLVSESEFALAFASVCGLVSVSASRLAFALAFQCLCLLVFVLVFELGSLY